MKGARAKVTFVLIVCILFSLYSIAAAIVINEFSVDPQSDWNADGVINSSDEFVELYNNGATPVNVSGWNLSLIDTNQEGAVLSGIIPAKSFLVVVNVQGAQANDGRILLADSLGAVVDAVSYGSFNDGNASDNAPDGDATTLDDACIARIPNGQDTNNDKVDFKKTICTFNKTNNIITFANFSQPLCAIANDNVTLMAHVIGVDVQEVIFSYTIAGVSVNKSGSLVLGTQDRYSYTIDKSELQGGVISWNVIAKDSFGNSFTSPVQNLPVKNKTRLELNPAVPDGQQGWYVSEPVFSLVADASALASYYEWDSAGKFLYTGAFTLDTIPNAPPKESAGTLELHWWSEFACGNESENMQTLFVDLTDPRIINLKPVNGSVVKITTPGIEAHLDEVYNSNSGINKAKTTLKLDGVPVAVDFLNASSGDLIIKHVPLTGLSEGIHTVRVDAEDNAGRTASLEWSFTVNTSNLFNMTVNKPADNVFYNSNKILFDIVMNQVVDALYYVDIQTGKQKVLCRNCAQYGNTSKKQLTLRDGLHNLTFTAVENGEILGEKTMSFFIDSVAPRILQGTKEKISNDSFTLSFVEKNPVEVQVHYGNHSELFSLATDCTKNTRTNSYLCEKRVDLSAYDGEEIEYFFTVKDIAGNTKTSAQKKFLVDVSPPQIVQGKVVVNGSTVEMTVEVDELNFKKITYKDMSELHPQEKLLCSQLKFNACHRTKKFKPGAHEIHITVYDEAGNTATQQFTVQV